MRYVLRQKLFSWGDDFHVQDEEGRQVYFVDGKVFSLGNQLAFIRQKLLAWGPTYEITRGDNLVAVVKKKLFTLLRCRFTVDVPGPDDLEAQGSFLDHEYTFERHGQPVAQVSKKWFSWTDTYGVDVANGEDEVLILASTVVIDMVCHQESKRD